VERNVCGRRRICEHPVNEVIPDAVYGSVLPNIRGDVTANCGRSEWERPRGPTILLHIHETTERVAQEGATRPDRAFTSQLKWNRQRISDRKCF
jgi:hypothetical protein